MEQKRNRGPFEQLGEAVGGSVGKMMGRANDMALTAAGSLLGSAVQALGGWWATPAAQRASRSASEREDHAWREHFESSAGAKAGGKHDYDSARQLYQFGYVAGQNPDYQAKPFDSVEAELERAWEALGRDRFGEWPEVREQVSYGYTYRSPGAPNAT